MGGKGEKEEEGEKTQAKDMKEKEKERNTEKNNKEKEKEKEKKNKEKEKEKTKEEKEKEMEKNKEDDEGLSQGVSAEELRRSQEIVRSVNPHDFLDQVRYIYVLYCY